MANQGSNNSIEQKQQAKQNRSGANQQPGVNKKLGGPNRPAD